MRLRQAMKIIRKSCMGYSEDRDYRWTARTLSRAYKRSSMRSNRNAQIYHAAIRRELDAIFAVLSAL